MLFLSNILGYVREEGVKGRFIWPMFWALVVVFAISIMVMFAQFMPMRFNAFIAWPILFVLGVILLVLTIRTQMEGKLKRFLLITGASPIGFVVFVFLHNIISGLFNTEEAIFFTLATMVCPVGFLVGAIGSIVLNAKRIKAN